MSFGNLPVSLTDLRVAPLNADGTYGTAVQDSHGRILTITPNMTTAKVKAYGKTAAVAAIVEDANVALEGGGYSWDVLAVVAGATVTESGVTPAQEKSAPIAAGSNLSYWGVVGKALGDDGGDIHVGCPKVKLTKMPETKMDGDGNAFVTGNMEGLAIADDSGYVIYPLAHETAGAIDFTEIFA